MIPFSIDEILGVAEQIERNGAAFYRKAAEGTDDESARSLLTNLAAMEDSHLEVFSRMRTELTEKDKESTAFDPEGEVELYLQAYASGHIFDVSIDPAERLGSLGSMEEVLKYAIGIEKDSVVYYTGMRDLVPERLGRDKVDGIIKEEMKHVAMLSSQLAALGKR